MRRACLFNAVLLGVLVGVALLGLMLCAGPAWSQGQMIPGNRTLAGTLNAGPTTGTGVAYVLTLSPPITAYVTDQYFAFRAHTANTGPATLNVNGAGAKLLKKWQSGVLVDLVAGDIPAGHESMVYYDGTVFQMVTIGSGGVSSAGGGTAVGPAGGLQASAGGGNFAAYSGDTCPTAGTFVRGMSSTGDLDCQPATTSTLTAKAWLSQPGSDAPNGINMGALSPGMVRIAVSGGVATPSTVPEPAGALVGTNGPQTLINTGITPRRQMAQNTATSVTVDVDATDIVTIANLQQGLTITDVTGSADPGQWVRFELCSTTARTLSWSSQWSGEAGLALPTATKGGGYCDLLLFQYNASSGHFVLVSNVDLFSRACPGILTPGSYTNTNMTVDARGCISAVSTGAGGGGGGTATPAGVSGDVQFNLAGSLAADSHNFAYDVANTLAVQNIQMGRAGGYLKFQDAGGRSSYLMQGSRLTNTRVYTLPNEDGELCVKGGSCAVAGGLSASGTPSAGQTAEWVSATALQGVNTQGTGNYVKAATAGASSATFLRGDFTWATPAGAGNVSNVGTPASGQLAEWTSSTTIQGVATQGTGAPLRATSPTITTPSIAALANLTTNGTVTTTAGTGTLVVDQTAVQPLTSSTTYTCARNGTVNQCKMSMTGAAGSLTIAAPTGTPQDGDRMLMRIRCTNAQTLALNAIFIASANVPLPTSCPADTTREVMIGALYSSDITKWQVIATN